MGAPSSPYDLSASGVKFANPCVYRGGCAFATGAAVVKVWDNNAAVATGLLLDVFDVEANKAVVHDITGGVSAKLGIYVQVVSGSPEGTVRIS